MKLSEEEIRIIVRSVLVENMRNEGALRKLGKTVKNFAASKLSGDTQEEYQGDLLTTSSGKKFIGSSSEGVSPPGFWAGFRSDLNAHIDKEYPELGIEIANLGVTRELGKAADPGGNKARVAGSKHGAGLAQDVYLHTKKYGKFTSFKSDNKKLAQDQKLVDSIISFLNTPKYKDVVYWGGAFGSGSSSLNPGDKPRRRGILEFHHFEFPSKDMPKYFAPFKDELQKIGINSDSLNSTRALSKLYKKLLGMKPSSSGSALSEGTLGNLGRNVKNFSKEKSDSGPADVTDPVSVKGGGYPQENIKHVEKAMTDKGITNKFLRIGILCTIAKESNFKPKNEKTYHNTGLSRIYEIWPKLKKLGDAKVEEMKKSTSPSDGHKQAGLGFFDYLYGGKYGNGPEKTGDGSKYRGRGFNQVTFKSSYEKYGKLAGIDLVGNPDLLNQPDIAAKVAVAFLANRIKTQFGTVNPDVKSQAEGIKIAAEANCKSPGAKKDCSRAIKSATERLPHFAY